MNWQVLAQVKHEAQRLGGRCMLVGGAVRDMLLGKPLHDYDFAVLPDAVRLGRAVANAAGGDFYVMDAERGTARVLLPGDGQRTVLDFAQVRGNTFEQDLRARDFTVNAIALDLAKWDGAPAKNVQPLLFDPLNGAADLQQHIVRMCAPTSIDDDPIRAMRAVRLGETLIATFTTETLEAVRRARIDPTRISHERVRDEFFKILALPPALALVRRLHAFGLLGQFLPEAVARLGNAQLPEVPDLPELRNYFAAELGQERTRMQILRLAALLQHLPPKAAAQAANRLRLSGDETGFLRTVLEVQPQLAAINDMPAGNARDIAVYGAMRDGGTAMPAACWMNGQLQCRDALIALYFSRYAPDVAPATLIDGSDLLALGLRPGPHIGKLLDDVRCAQMTGKISTREQALALVSFRA
jgi:tRNA nucleotidyltransferase/poly(A) polymerase